MVLIESFHQNCGSEYGDEYGEYGDFMVCTQDLEIRRLQNQHDQLETLGISKLT